MDLGRRLEDVAVGTLGCEGSECPTRCIHEQTSCLISSPAGYAASYDAPGDMTCRAPTSSTAFSWTQTGTQLTCDTNAGWQNQPTNPTSQTSNLYDGEEP